VCPRPRSLLPDNELDLLVGIASQDLQDLQWHGLV
jgi:hypothetical protein